MINLRAHHLLCSVLYKGAGYSEEFVKNMDIIVESLRKKETLVCVLETPDAICKDCPNKKTDGGCLLDEKNSSNHEKIESLDKNVLREFGIVEGKEYRACELFEKIETQITREYFEKCCNKCRWYKAGYCNYDEYIARIRDFLQ